MHYSTCIYLSVQTPFMTLGNVNGIPWLNKNEHCPINIVTTKGHIPGPVFTNIFDHVNGLKLSLNLL